ncbi:MAG: hypothetical protein AAF745_09260, partial [Planctomycetota bacterium]
MKSESSTGMLADHQVTVQLADRSYPIHILTSATGRFAAGIRAAIPDLTHALVVHDQSVSAWADDLADSLRTDFGSALQIDPLAVPSGET